MKRLIPIILACVILMLSLCSCSSDPELVAAPEGMKLASDADSAYYLYVPEAWGLTEGYSTFGAYASDASNVVVSTYTADDIGSDDTSADTSAEETTAGSAAAKTEREKYINAYWDMCWKSFMTELKGFSVVEDGKQTLLGGFDAKQYVYTAKYENVEYKMQMTVTYSGGLMYILTYTAKADNYDTHIKEVEKIISEFKFT